MGSTVLLRAESESLSFSVSSLTKLSISLGTMGTGQPGPLEWKKTEIADVSSGTVGVLGQTRRGRAGRTEVVGVLWRLEVGAGW